MIKVTRLNKSQLWVNADLIQFIEETPDTVITLTTDVKIIVKEPAAVLVKAIMAYRQATFQQPLQVAARPEEDA